MATCINGTCNGQNEIQNATQNKAKRGGGFLRNPYLENIEDDVLFHLKLSTKTNDFKAMFGDVKFVCIGGTARRMKECARFIMQGLELKLPEGTDLEDLTAEGHRYSMFKAGCVLCVNHGMGPASIMILLNEVIKLLHYAEVDDPIIIRLGTSGSVDTPNGTVVISSEAVNDFFEPYCLVPILGKLVKRPAVLDQNLARELKKFADDTLNFPVITGKTMSQEHFYESVASPSGTICEHTDEDRNNYYNLLKQHAVTNLDMESVALSSLTHLLGIKSAIVNVVINGVGREMVPPTAEERSEWEKRPLILITEYIKQYLHRKSKTK